MGIETQASATFSFWKLTFWPFWNVFISLSHFSDRLNMHVLSTRLLFEHFKRSNDPHLAVPSGCFLPQIVFSPSPPANMSTPPFQPLCARPKPFRSGFCIQHVRTAAPQRPFFQAVGQTFSVQRTVL